jgi:hypothetical protein
MFARSLVFLGFVLSALPFGLFAQSEDHRHCEEPTADIVIVECASRTEIDWLVRHYQAYARPILRSEQRLPNGVAWRLQEEPPLGLAMPRIVSMADQRAMARANRLFDALHAELMLEYARQAIEYRRGARRSAESGYGGFMVPVKSMYSSQGTELTYASPRLVSYTEAIVEYTGGTALGAPVEGRVLDLESERIFNRSPCHQGGMPGAYFRLGELLEICDDKSADAFETLWRKAVDSAAAAPDFADSSEAVYCFEAMTGALDSFALYLTPSGLAVHTMDFFPNSARWDCSLNKTAANPVIIPYPELASLMKPGPWRDELLK